MFNEITEIANAVSGGADDIANASNSLASSCTLQIHSISDFKETVVETVELINLNDEDFKRLAQHNYDKAVKERKAK